MTKSLEDRIASLEDAILHQNEIEFEILCEKYIDECAMRAMQALLSNSHLQKEFLKDLKKIEKNMGRTLESKERSDYMQSQHAMISYQFAEVMLKEKLKRNETK